MKVLVTGATGFVGGAVARRFLARGAHVHAYVRDAPAAGELAAAGARVFEGSLGDPNAIAGAAAGCEVVVHAAAIASHHASPRALGWVNVAGTENVLLAARHAGVSRLVHVSCADVTLTRRRREHWSEDISLFERPLDAHAVSKRSAEEAVIGACCAAMGTTVLRPGMVWGPGDTTHLPGLCREGLEGGILLVGRGDNLIGLTYVDNLVEAVEAAAVRAEAHGGVYYLMDAELHLARDFYGELSEALELPPPRPGVPYGAAMALASVRKWLRLPGLTPSDVAHRGQTASFDCSRARLDLRCEARVGRSEGLAALAAWVRSVGGVAAVARMGRAAPDDASVAGQIALAES